MTESQVADQPPPQPSQGDMWRTVINDMEKRRLTGIDRYGTPLQAHNGRDALVDAYQEGLDFVVYLRQAIEEVRELRTAARRAIDRLDTPHKHNWRPDLIRCENELDAISILRNAIR